MTYVLTVLSDPYVHHASDRLLSRPRGRALPLQTWDEEANKTVIYFGPGGHFVLGYSGTAHLDGIPTDHFIAQSLHGQPIPWDHGSSGWHEHSGHADSSVHAVLPILARDLDAALRRLPAADARTFHILSGGWLYGPAGPRQFLQKLGTITGPPLRPWHDLLLPETSFVGAAPPRFIGRANSQPLVHELLRARLDPAEMADVLTKEIQNASDIAMKEEGSRRIGRDVMIVTLSMPPFATIRFRRDGSAPDLPIYPLFTPWVIEPGWTWPPNRITGSLGIGSSRWITDMTGMTPRSGGVRPQKRRRPPGQ